MKNYLVFYSDKYNPLGGMGDFIAAYDSMEEAEIALENYHKKKDLEDSSIWAHIFSLIDEKIVAEYGVGVLLYLEDLPCNFRAEK